MIERRVRFSETARDHVNLERTWWQNNRDNQAIFAAELQHAIQVLSILPGAGSLYPDPSTAGLRRLYVRKLNCHLYYTFDEHEVLVRALWGASREHGPSI